MRSNILFVLILCLSTVTLNACNKDTGKIETEAKYPTGYDRSSTGDDNIYAKSESIFGPEGLSILGSKHKNANDDGSSGVNVNSFLWRASLDTVSFMPIASADPFGGTILTDWYTAPENTNERMKINVFILTRELKSDGVSVRLFRQVTKNGRWVDQPASEDTARQLEDTILTRARQLRVAQLGGIDK